MLRKSIIVLLALSLAFTLVSGAYPAELTWWDSWDNNGPPDDGEYWPSAKYVQFKNEILTNVPRIEDDLTTTPPTYRFSVSDGLGGRTLITNVVRLTDPDVLAHVRTSVEEYYEARTGGGAVVKRRNVEDWTWAIRFALQKVADAGGGTVVFPTRAAAYITGAMRFRGNNSRIHLEDGVSLEFIRNTQYGTNYATQRPNPTINLPPITHAGTADDPYDDWYPQEKTRFECRDFYGFSPLVYAYRLKNLALTGAGYGGWNSVTTDGRGGTVDGAITPEPGSKLSIIDGMADSYNMRSIQSGSWAVYDEDGTTQLATSVTRNHLDPLTGAPVPTGTAGAVSIGTYLDGNLQSGGAVVGVMNDWEPMESPRRRIPDLIPMSMATANEQKARILRMANGYRMTFIEPHESQNFLMENFYLRNSPFWEGHPQYSQYIRVANLHINSHGGNNDGCNPDSSQYVLIEGNIFNTGDDCIAIKCGRDNDGYQDWNMPSTHIIIRNCLMRDGHGGCVAGSEMGGGVEWVFSHNNTYFSPYLYYGLRIKTASSRGGYVRNIYMTDTEVGALSGGLVRVNFFYDADGDTRTPEVRDIYVSNYRTVPGGFTDPPALGLIFAKQYGSSPISDIHFKDCDFAGFYQSPNSPKFPNRPVTNIMCTTEEGVQYNNVKIDGELYQPPKKSVEIKKLIFTETTTGESVLITKPEDIEYIINSSRLTGGIWDVSIVARIDGYSYKGANYGIGDSIPNSTYTATQPSGGIYNISQNTNIRSADNTYPYYRVNGMPAYEAFVRVGSNYPANDWGTNSGTGDCGPRWVSDMRVTEYSPLGDNEYLIWLRRGLDMGRTTPGRAPGFNSLNKVEVVVRNALFNEDQDFVFYSALPRVIKMEFESTDTITVTYDRPMTNNLSLLADAKIKIIDDLGNTYEVNLSAAQWNQDGTSVSYKVPAALTPLDPNRTYSGRLDDRERRVLSYFQGTIATIEPTEPEPKPKPEPEKPGCNAASAGLAVMGALSLLLIGLRKKRAK